MPWGGAGLAPSPTIVGFDRFVFDRESGILLCDGEEVPLAPRCVAILSLLVERAGKVVRKEELVEAVWKGAFVSDTAVAEGISQLRSALGDAAAAPRIVQTVHRRGYRFIARLTEGPNEGLTEPAPPPAVKRPRRPGLVLAGGVALGLLALAGWRLARGFDRAAPEGPGAARFDLVLPKEVRAVDSLALSPSGRELAFVGRGSSGSRLYLRRLASPEIEPLEGSEGAAWPFFSPDGSALGFFAEGELLTVETEGGSPRKVCDVRLPSGGAWGDDGRIVYATASPGALWTVAAQGGRPGKVVTHSSQPADLNIAQPVFLPGRRRVAATVGATSITESRIDLFDLETGKRSTLASGAARPFVVGDRLFYARADGLYSDRLQGARLAGQETRSPEPVRVLPAVGAAAFALARNGTLAHLLPVEPPAVDLAWIGSPAASLPVLARAHWLTRLQLSPTADRAALTLLGSSSDVWIYDLRRGARTRLTHEGFNVEPVWSPSGDRICFGSRRTGAYDIYCQATSGRRPAEPLVVSAHNKLPTSWSPDGGWLVYAEAGSETGVDLWRHSVAERRAEPLLATPADEGDGRVSPDGRWWIYCSNENGRSDVFLDSFPLATHRIQISQDGGESPFWGDRGRQIVFVSGDRVLSATFDPDTATAGKPELLYEGPATLEAQPDPLSARVLIARRPLGSVGPARLRLVLPGRR